MLLLNGLYPSAEKLSHISIPIDSFEGGGGDLKVDTAAYSNYVEILLCTVVFNETKKIYQIVRL